PKEDQMQSRRFRNCRSTNSKQQAQVQGSLILSSSSKSAAQQQQVQTQPDITLDHSTVATKNRPDEDTLTIPSKDTERQLTCEPRDISSSMARHLLATTEAEHQVKGGLLLDVVVRQSAAILELLTSKDEALLVRGDALLVLDLRLDVVYGVRRLNLERDGLAGEGLDEDLHSTTQAEHQVEGGLLLDVVVSEGATVLKLLASKDEALLVRRDALLVLDLRLDVVDRVRGLDLKGDGLAGEGLHKDLHLGGRESLGFDSIGNFLGLAWQGGLDEW
uniref:Uncharacterized protein n=1 Tax=Aegilops tauschii subsp. strangulata TaxID=200361 RepID=A0A453JVS0_AEGTS